MPAVYVVTPEVLSKLKEPFGTLIKGTSKETGKKLKEIVEKEKPPMVISVGDAVSRNLNKNLISTHLLVTDNKSHRRKLHPQSFQEKNLVKVKNPQGTITQEAITAIREALAGPKQVHVLVEGEEDLLTLIAVLYAPENALVVYGQPHTGVVVVKATPQKREQAEKILKEMKTVKEKD